MLITFGIPGVNCSSLACPWSAKDHRKYSGVRMLQVEPSLNPVGSVVARAVRLTVRAMFAAAFRVAAAFNSQKVQARPQKK